jgi:hypothetical protein
MRGKPIWHHPLIWLLGISCTLAVANGLILPSFEAIDEPEHFNFARYLAEGNGLPDQRDSALARQYGFGQEGGQAPLYYLLSALILRGLGEDVSDVAALTIPNPLSTCGYAPQPYSKGLWMRDPRREAWPYYGAALGVHVLRLFSSALALLTISGVYLTARATFPASRATGLVAAALVGFNPRFLTHSATVNNDNLLAALAAWGVYLAADTLRRGPSLVKSLALGIIAGLASLAKVSGVFLLPLAALVLADVAWRERRSLPSPTRGGTGGGGKWPRSLRHLGLIFLLSLLIAGWWYAGNLVRYGNLGLMPLLTQEAGQRAQWSAHLVIPETLQFLSSYWAVSPYCGIRLGFLPVYAALSLLGLIGLSLGMRQADSATRRRAALLLIWVGVTFLAWFRFNAMIWAPDGRYLFQAHAAIAPLLAAGLLALVKPLGSRVYGVMWRGLVVGLGVLALGTPVEMLAPLFNPPPRYPVDQAPITRPLEASFGEQVALLGYDVSSESPRAGDAVDVTLYLKAEHPITENLILGLQLVSAGPHDDTLLVNLMSWPGGGNYPTTVWQPGEVLADRYRLRLPADVPEVQLWDLSLIFLRPFWQGWANERLPVRIGGVQDESCVALTRLRVEPRVVSPPPAEAVLHAPPTFGPEREIVLEAAEVVPDGTDLRVSLWWRVRGPLGRAYTVFVQLLDEQWHLVASGDGPPREGAMPTDHWRAGDLIVDEHRIPVPESLLSSQEMRTGESTYRIGVGFYDPDWRLPAWDAEGRSLPEATAIIGEWR